MDIETRLRTLFAARKNILDLFGGEMPAPQPGESAEANLNEAIARWISFGPKKRGEFYEWLREKGYTDKAKASASEKTAPSGEPRPEPPALTPQPAKEYAWVLVETRTNEEDMNDRLALTNSKNPHSKQEVSASSGSAVFTNTYIGPDQTKTLGRHLFPGNATVGEITWTAPPKASYGPEDEVILRLTVQNTARDSSYPLGNNWTVLAQHFLLDEKGGQSGSAAYLLDEDGETSFTCGPGNGWQSFDITVSAKLGTGFEEGARKAVRISASGGVPVETYYIYEWKGTN
ncbi:MAG: hypothetical protein PHE09_13930 [Oscillospiraceae bacterium]|nr:hypothetical protein [Oscillospiraceae bacterium]